MFSKAVAGGETLPATAFTGPVMGDEATMNEISAMAAANGCIAEPFAEPPLPHLAVGPWKPPGVSCPWPAEEYLCDGGDEPPSVRVDEDWQIYGLDVEDTVAHYDTPEGERRVEPSNRVCIYAPRFGSVRSVVSPNLNEQINAPLGVEQPVRLVKYDEVQEPSTKLQHGQAQGQIAVRRTIEYEAALHDGAVSTALSPATFQDAMLPHEAISIIRHGVFEQAEKAQLATGIAAAIAWTHVQAVQVILDRNAATEVVGDRKAQATYTIDKVPGCPMLRVVKVASTAYAQPGDVVDFTIRFDNVGSETLGNVTIVDNLTTRLEYVADSAQASVAMHFATEANEGESLVLRFEIDDPLRPGAGGVARFRCRVR